MHSDDIDIDSEAGAAAPVWAVFGDLMAGLVGAFVLILVGAIGLQFDLPRGWRPKCSSGSSRPNGAKRSKPRWPARWRPAA